MSTLSTPTSAPRRWQHLAVALACFVCAPVRATTFTLIDADRDQPIPGHDPLRSGTLNLATLPTRNLNVRANTTSGPVGSVRVSSTNPALNRVEGVAPFALAGDTNGDYLPWTPGLGSQRISATPFSGPNGTGSAGGTHTITLNVINQAVTPGASFTLIDADSDQPLPGFDPIRSGTTLILAALPTRNLNLRANVPATTGSVRFGYDQNPAFNTESVAPFALGGDASGDYAAWTPTAGAHTVTATPYSQPNAQGQAGQTSTLSFTVVDRVAPAPVGAVTGELRTWHRVTVNFRGPMTNEGATPNPFLFYRLSVTFVGPGGETHVVPGYYAADGRAGDTSANRGDVWRAHFAPPRAGTWTYRASFRQGTNVAVNRSPNAGTPTAFDGASGSFAVAATNKTGRDHRAKGLLRYVRKHHLQFAGNGEYFLKGGADSPENFLGYHEFDNTRDLGGLPTPGLVNGLHHYTPHLRDARAGDPRWGNGKGAAILGALNYLASRGGNSLYFLTYNTDGGDGRDTWPWVQPTQRERFDVSKLAQWEVVFSHMDTLGIQLHVVTQENENDRALDGGNLGLTRKLYYRELVARFGHHLALIWNLGEENRNSNAQRKAFAAELRALDAYDHPITVHTFFDQASTYYNGVLGDPAFEATSIQGKGDRYNAWAVELRRRSKAAGRAWAIYGDEQGPAVSPQLSNLDELRKDSLWGNLMGGGAGVEWYFGYQGTFGDVQSENWRVTERLWDQTRHALSFFQQHLPFADMEPRNDLVSGAGVLGLAKPGDVYAVYLPNAGTAASLNLAAGSYSVQWYNPETGGNLVNGGTITGPGRTSLGSPPGGWDDAVALVSKAGGGAAGTALAQGGRAILEAEAATLSGDWRRVTLAGRTALLYAGADSFVRPPAGQTLTYQFRADQTGTWFLGLHTARDPSVMSMQRFDLGNDAWIVVEDVASGNVVRSAVKLYTDFGLRNLTWRWGDTFDFGGQKPKASFPLTAGRVYRLKVIGRSTGYAIDRITLQNGAVLLDANGAPSPTR